MGMNDNAEGLNLPKSTLTEFFDDIEGRLAFLTGMIDYEQFGLTLEDIRKPVLVVGKPGVGKTSGIISSIREMNKKLHEKYEHDMEEYKFRSSANKDGVAKSIQKPTPKKLGFKKILLGQTVVGSLSGIPVAQADGSVIRVQIPDLPDPVRDGEYGVLFLDEVTTADEMQIQPALGLCDDSRSLGEYTLPEHWLVVCAGNGPDCTNFVRMDDMTLSRFSAYDINYSYMKDFRPYAHRTGLNEDIIAFLNFSPDTCVRVESSDMDNAGKQFPCPRTWERLSVELKMRQARGKAVDPDQIANFAGRMVGIKAGREFGAFMQFRKNLNYDAKKILAGEERDPEVGMAKETYHIIMQHLFKTATDEIKSHGGGDDVPLEMYQRVGNMITWILKFHELENKINAIIEIRDELPAISNLMFDEDFCDTCCPTLNQFFDENMALLQSSIDELQNMRF